MITREELIEKMASIQLLKVPIEVHQHILNKGGTVTLTYEVTEINKVSEEIQ